MAAPSVPSSGEPLFISSDSKGSLSSQDSMPGKLDGRALLDLLPAHAVVFIDRAAARAAVRSVERSGVEGSSRLAEAVGYLAKLPGTSTAVVLADVLAAKFWCPDGSMSTFFASMFTTYNTSFVTASQTVANNLLSVSGPQLTGADTFVIVVIGVMMLFHTMTLANGALVVEGDHDRLNPLDRHVYPVRADHVLDDDPEHDCLDDRFCAVRPDRAAAVRLAAQCGRSQCSRHAARPRLTLINWARTSQSVPPLMASISSCSAASWSICWPLRLPLSSRQPAPCF